MKFVPVITAIAAIAATPLLIFWWGRCRRIRKIDDQARWLVYSLPAGPAFEGWEIGIERERYDHVERDVRKTWEIEPGESEKLDVLADATVDARRRNFALELRGRAKGQR